jgi:hypothetical protein
VYEPSWLIDPEDEIQRRMMMEKDLSRYVEQWEPTIFRSKHYKARVLRAKARRIKQW